MISFDALTTQVNVLNVALVIRNGDIEYHLSSSICIINTITIKFPWNVICRLPTHICHFVTNKTSHTHTHNIFRVSIPVSPQNKNLTLSNKMKTFSTQNLYFPKIKIWTFIFRFIELQQEEESKYDRTSPKKKKSS